VTVPLFFMNRRRRSKRSVHYETLDVWSTFHS